MNSKFRLPLLLLISFLIIFISCNKENPIPEPAPGAPPPSTMVMDFDDFTDQDTSSSKYIQSYQHWGRAASTVAVWNSFITLTLAVPIASYREAFNHEGIYDPDLDSWKWSYNFTPPGGIVHLAELYASLENDSIKWEMYISKNNSYTDFLWFSGTSDPGSTGGYWNLNYDPVDPSPFIKIEWNRDVTENSADIKYINIIPDAPNYGSYIHHGIYVGSPFNAFYDMYNTNSENAVNIKWNRDSKDGRIMDEHFFGDSEWRCWDTLLKDIICFE